MGILIFISFGNLKYKGTHYPEVVTTGLPNMMTVPEAERHQPRTKVTCKVDGITCLPTEASTDAKDDEEESEWCEVPCPNIPIILQGATEARGQHTSHRQKIWSETTPERIIRERQFI
jgi:hypothetical protein